MQRHYNKVCEKNCLSIKTDVLPISATPTAKCLAHFLGGIKWRTQRKFSTSFHKKWTDQISKKKWRFAFFFPLDGCWIKNVKNLFFFLRRQEESFLQKKTVCCWSLLREMHQGCPSSSSSSYLGNQITLVPKEKEICATEKKVKDGWTPLLDWYSSRRHPDRIGSVVETFY